MSFELNTVLDERINSASLRAYCIKFDFGVCMLNPLSDILLDALVDFAYGFHQGIQEHRYNRRVLREAATSLYKIKGFSDAKKLYLDDDSVLQIDDSDKADEVRKYEEQIMKKGEFGELLLHVYLRDYFETVPLLSKIFFKDTDGFTVHGFDAIHIGNDPSDLCKDSLFLGESKLYYRKAGKSGVAGVKDLVNDIKEHFYRDFLTREFALVSKKKDAFLPVEDYCDKNTIDSYKEYLDIKNSWITRIQKVCEGKESLENLLSSVTIPVICTYESELFITFTDICQDGFVDAYNAEVRELEAIFKDEIKRIVVEKGEPIRTNLNIILILLPIPSKKDIVKLLHHKVWNQQNA